MDVRSILRRNSSSNGQPKVDSLCFTLFQLYTKQDHERCLHLIQTLEIAKRTVPHYARFLAGLIYLHQGKHHDALQSFQHAVQGCPTSFMYIQQIAKMQRLQSNHAAALETLDQARQLFGEHPALHAGRALCQLAAGSTTAALESFQAAHRLEQHEAIYTVLGKVYADAGKHSHGLAAYTRALEICQQDAHVHSAAGALAAALGETDAALRHLEASLAADPRHVRALVALGALKQGAGDVDGAVVQYGAALAVTAAQPEALSNYGMCCLTKGLIAAGATATQTATDLHPLQWLLHLNTGILQLAQGRPAAALQRFSAALSIKQDCAPAYLHLALALDALGESDTAMAALDKCMAMQEASGAAESIALHVNYAVVAFNAGRQDVAQQQYSALLNVLRSMEERMVPPGVVEKRQAFEQAMMLF